MQYSKNQDFAQLVPLFDRLRALAEHGDGFATVPRSEAFGSAIHDLAQPFRSIVPIVETMWIQALDARGLMRRLRCRGLNVVHKGISHAESPTVRRRHR